VDRLTELVEMWRKDLPTGPFERMDADLEDTTLRRCANELEAAIAAELSDAKKRETQPAFLDTEWGGDNGPVMQPATPSAREFAKELGAYASDNWHKTGVIDAIAKKLTTHDAEIVDAAFRSATRQLGGEFSAGVPEFTEALAKRYADIRAEALREAVAIARRYQQAVASMNRRGVEVAQDIEHELLALIPARPENAKPAGT
jgi:hypothetical protein